MDEEPSIRRRLAAILAADIAGYSRLMGQDEAATVRDLKGHQAVILPLVGRHGGRIIDMAGDGILAEFPSVIGATECAVEIQTVMAARNEDVPEHRRMLFRIGINLGDVIHDETRIYGDGINVAARLEGLAEPAGMLVSRAVHDQVRDRLDLAFEDLGERELKNIARPVRVYRVRTPAESKAAPCSGDALPLPDKPSIAVLPFPNMSGDPEQGVLRRWDSRRHHHRPLAAEMAVRDRTQLKLHLQGPTRGCTAGRTRARGSLRPRRQRSKDGNRIRITGQLVEAETGNPLSAERYDRALGMIRRQSVRSAEPSMRAPTSQMRTVFLGVPMPWADGRTTADVAKTLGLPKEKVRLISPFIGGGFGGKLFLRADALLAALGARAARRPVKVALPRPLMFNNTTHRAATIQRIRIGATRDGQITAIGHETWSGDLPGGRPEAGAMQTRLLYAGANRLTATRLAVLDLPEASAMRAPGEAPGLMVLEIAIDEMAEKLGLDPIEFRILNDTQVDPEKPSQRNARPGQHREGRWRVGMGVASALRNNLVTKSAARVRLDNRGLVTVETDMTDIGTGTYTIIAQTAAEMMGVPLDRVVVRLGDSTYPVSCGSGGQWGANNSTAGVYAACVKLREAVAQRIGFNSADALFADGQVRSDNRSVSLAQAAGESGIAAEDAIEYGDLDKKYQQSTFGAHFVEVGVDAATAEIRMRRMLAVCAAGRILNPKSARSQVIGAMTMGAGAALMEELAVDKRLGFFVNHDLAGYEVPVHADIPHQEVIFLDETDPLSSPMKAKGVGELGICGVGAAVANAIYNATGVRVRHYPITLDKLLDRLPDVSRDPARAAAQSSRSLMQATVPQAP